MLVVLRAATEPTADMTSKPFALKWQDFPEIWVGPPK